MTPPTPVHTTLLLIGIGNPLRRDDGAGWVLAQRLAEALPGARLRLVQQLTPELAVDLAATDLSAVCFCDARNTARNTARDTAYGGPPLLLLERVTADVPEHARMSHEIGPATLLAYAALVPSAAGHMTPPRVLPAWLVTLGGIEFDHGEGLSAPVTEALEAVPALARTLAAAIEQQRR